MSSLYVRANPMQARVLRIVDGAIRNAAHHHPEIIVSPQHRRSIAKRAAGTLTAAWPDCKPCIGPAVRDSVVSLTSEGGLSLNGRPRFAPQLDFSLAKPAPTDAVSD